MSGPAAPVDLVVDASVAVKWFVPEVHSPEARLLLVTGYRRHVPVLFYTEVAQTVWKKVYQRGELGADDGRAILRDVLVTPLEAYPTIPLLGPAFEIAAATGRTVYDSVYLALAVALGCRLVTADRRLYNALRGGPFAGEAHRVADPV